MEAKPASAGAGAACPVEASSAGAPRRFSGVARVFGEEAFARIAAGSSLRGLSSVMIATRLPRAAAAPIPCLFSGSRSPPQPSTEITGPASLSELSAASTAWGAWAKSTTTSGAPSPRWSRCILPGTWAPASPRSAASAGTPTASSIARATTASIMLYSPGRASRSCSDSPPRRTVAEPPRAPSAT